MEENMQEKLEEIAMMIIANSGQARSDAFAALQEAKKGNFEDAEKLLKEAEESLQTAHESHRELLKMDASGEVTQVSILLCHAQDHLMGSALALDLIREMIVLYLADIMSINILPMSSTAWYRFCFTSSIGVLAAL